MVLELLLLLLILAMSYSGCRDWNDKRVSSKRDERINDRDAYARRRRKVTGSSSAPTVSRNTKLPSGERILERLSYITNDIYSKYTHENTTVFLITAQGVGSSPTKGCYQEYKDPRSGSYSKTSIGEQVVRLKLYKTTGIPYDENTLVQVIIGKLAEYIKNSDDDIYSIESDLFKIAYESGHYDPFENADTDSFL